MASLHSAVRAYRFASEELVYSESAVAGLLASREERAGDHDKFFQSPGRILSLLNRHLYRSTQPEKYATLFLAHYDAPSSRLTYSNAGQLPPLVLSQDGSIRRLDRGGTVVGLMDGMRYEEDSFHMQPGEILVAYSDGVTEPENDFGEFGEERLMEVVARYRDQPLHVISNQVMLALDAWIGAEEQPDDIPWSSPANLSTDSEIPCTIASRSRQRARSSESAKPSAGQSASPAADPTEKTPRSSSLVSRC